MTAKPNDHEHCSPCAYYLYTLGLLCHLGVEFVRIDDKALMGGLADLVNLIEAFHLEGKLLKRTFIPIGVAAVCENFIPIPTVCSPSPR
jgi:hypothetical protein